MNVFFDLIPLFLFFAAYKFVGIYAATGVAIIACILQVTYTRVRHKKFELMQVVTCIMIVLLGGMTLAFHNPIFIKWKPTLLNWVMALVFIGSQLFYKQPLIQYLFKKKLTAENHVWRTLNYMWIAFFIFIGTANIIVAYSVDTDTWVNFKVFGTIGLFFLFSLVQVSYLNKHAKIS